MEAFLVSTGIVALAEIGDKTQLLAFILAASCGRADSDAKDRRIAELEGQLTAARAELAARKASPQAAPAAAPAPVAPLPAGFPAQLADPKFKGEVALIFTALSPALDRLSRDRGGAHLALISGFRMVSDSPAQTERRLRAALAYLQRTSDTLEGRYLRGTKRKLFDGQGLYADLIGALRFLQGDVVRFYGGRDRAARVLAEDMGGRDNAAGFLAVDFAGVESMASVIGAALADSK